jgi:hypothetical protein
MLKTILAFFNRQPKQSRIPTAAELIARARRQRQLEDYKSELRRAHLRARIEEKNGIVESLLDQANAELLARTVSAEPQIHVYKG